MQEEQQNELIASLRQALMVDDLPEITQIILNLAEFMEHCDKVIIINDIYRSFIIVPLIET